MQSGEVMLRAALCLTILATAQVRAVEPPTFDVPRMEGIAIDGKADDWTGKGLAINVLAPREGDMPSSEDFSARLKLGWDAKGLLLLAVVDDDTRVFAADQPAPLSDAIEVYIANAWDAKTWLQAILVPDFGSRTVHKHIYPFPKGREADKAKLAEAIEAAARPRDGGGYVLEARIGWQAVGMDAKPGAKIAFNATFDDRDRADQNDRFEIGWQAQEWSGRGPQHMQRLVLAETAGPAVNAATIIRSAKLPRQAEVTTYRLQTDSPVRLDGVDVISTRTTPLTETLSKVEQVISLPVQREGERGRLTVRVGDQPIQCIVLPDPSRRIRSMLQSLPLSYPPVFTGTQLPTIRFAHPSLAEALLGDYAIDVSYLDAQHKPVQQADALGRYGAVVKIKADGVGTVERHVTLCRVASRATFAAGSPEAVSMTLAALGVPPEVTVRQWPMIAEYLRNALSGQRPADQLAPFLAALLTCKPGDPSLRMDEWIDQNSLYWDRLPGRQPPVSYPYVAVLPGKYRADEARAWPVLIYLHGGGGADRRIKPADVPGDPSDVRPGYGAPYIRIVPQALVHRAGGRGWDPGSIIKLIDDVSARYRVDPNRIYLTGASMGGSGTWRTIAAYPGRFAAAAPVCGGGDVSMAWRVVNVPIWAFHGELDSVVSCHHSMRMDAALASLGGVMKLTVYPGVGHNSWEPAYAEPKLNPWFLANARGKPPVRPDAVSVK